MWVQCIEAGVEKAVHSHRYSDVVVFTQPWQRAAILLYARHCSAPPTLKCINDQRVVTQRRPHHEVIFGVKRSTILNGTPGIRFWDSWRQVVRWQHTCVNSPSVSPYIVKFVGTAMGANRGLFPSSATGIGEWPASVSVAICGETIEFFPGL